MRIEGNFQQDGYVVVRSLFDGAWVERMLPILEAARERFVAQDPESGEPGGDPTSFFHVNNPYYFPEGSPELRELLEAAASEQVASVFRLGCGTEPLFSHLSAWFDPPAEVAGGGWHRDMQYVFPDEGEEKERVTSGGAHWGGDPQATGSFSGIQIQVALLPESRHIEYVPSSHARWDTAGEYHVRKGDNFAHHFDDMPGAVRPVLGPGDAIAFTDGLHRGHYSPGLPRRTLMFTLSNGRRARGLDYFSFQPYFLQPGYLQPLSERAKEFYGRYIAEYTEMEEVAQLLAEHESGMDIARRQISSSASVSLVEAARDWAAHRREFTGQRPKL